MEPSKHQGCQDLHVHCMNEGPRPCTICRFVVIHYLHKSHNTVHLGGLFALKQWIPCSLKHDTVPRVNKLYRFYVKNPHYRCNHN